MICCVFAGLVECVFLHIGSAETDDLLCVCRSCVACVSAYWVSRDRWFVVCLQVLCSVCLCVLGQQRQMICWVLQVLWSVCFCVLGQQRHMICCVFVGLVVDQLANLYSVILW